MFQREDTGTFLLTISCLRSEQGGLGTALFSIERLEVEAS